MALMAQSDIKAFQDLFQIAVKLQPLYFWAQCFPFEVGRFQGLWSIAASTKPSSPQ